MKIAVIGGGASGMMTAHLLNAQHDVTVFEKESMLGGNIRTLNKNVTKTSLNKNIVIDNGVIEFATDQFPFFVKMMDNLKVKLSSFPGNGSLFLSNGKYIFGRNYIKTEVKGILNKSKETFKLLTLLPDLLKLEISIKLKQKNIQEFTTGEIFKNKILHSWLRSLSMYAHSVPYKEINKNYPAELCIFIFKTFKFGTKWAGIQSGVYTYIEKILELFKGNIILSSKIEGIIRNDKGVKVQLESGEELSFDRIVFSTPPDQILKLLKDPTEQEKKRFDGWKSNRITTFIHTDPSLYKPFPVQSYSEFDIFESSNGDFGYNAYMNRIANIDISNPYFMGYNIEKLIDTSKIIQRQNHATPFYTVEGIKYRQEIKDTNGENNTFYAGAYLYDGLHEGATISANEVAKKLNNAGHD